jgi:hypothetical protein
MRPVAVFAPFVLLLIVAVASSAAAANVPGIERNGPASRLAWFDPVTLRPAGATVDLGFHIGSWSFDPDRSRLAIAGGRASLRFVDLEQRAVLGTIDLEPSGKGIGAVTWLGPRRLLAFVRHPGATTVVSVDPVALAVVRRERLEATVAAAERHLGGLVLRLTNRKLAVVDADGSVRAVKIGAVARYGGLAVDPRGTAYVADATAVTEVDLKTLAVVRHLPLRSLAKGPGTGRLAARWLGGGRLALLDDGGLRVLDVRTWTLRRHDPGATSFPHATGLVLDREPGAVTAREPGGGVRWTLALPPETWLNVAGSRYAGLCAATRLTAVIDLGTGASTPRTGPCPFLLSGRWSSY